MIRMRILLMVVLVLVKLKLIGVVQELPPIVMEYAVMEK